VGYGDKVTVYSSIGSTSLSGLGADSVDGHPDVTVSELLDHQIVLKSDGDTLEFDEDLCEIRRSQKGGNPKAERWPRSDKITINAPEARFFRYGSNATGFSNVNAHRPISFSASWSALSRCSVLIFIR